MRKRISALCLLMLLLLSLCACSASYEGDERIGTYVDAETGAYTLVLRADGKGTLTHTSSTVLPTEEEIFFELRDGYLYINGRLDNGAVIGKNEYYGKLEKTDGVYRVSLKSEVTGVSLGTFEQTKSK